jgi:hypothetical protein
MGTGEVGYLLVDISTWCDFLFPIAIRSIDINELVQFVLLQQTVNGLALRYGSSILYHLITEVL